MKIKVDNNIFPQNSFHAAIILVCVIVNSNFDDIILFVTVTLGK